MLAIVASFALQALPHQPHLQLTGGASEQFGLMTRMIEDVDGDGRADVMVHSAGLGGGGTVSVHSGLDGALLHSIGVATGTGLVPEAIDGAGDVDADGVEDLLVGDPLANRASVFSGATGNPLLQFSGIAPGDGFGGAVRGVGDVNGDGHADCMVGTSLASVGYAFVYSGLDGSVLYRFRGKEAGDLFGGALAAVGDVNGDGHVDFAIGARGDGHPFWNPGFPPFVPRFLDDDDSGGVTVFSGADGRELYTVLGRADDDGFGYSLDPLGDVNGDGFSDFAAGSWSVDSPGRGYAQVISGRDGSTLLTVLDGDGPADYGMVQVSGTGDVDGDGVPDCLVGAHAAGFAAYDALLFSGANGTLLFSYRAEPGPPIGLITVDGGRDLDGDGTPDFLIGVHQAAYGAGYVQTFASGAP